MKALAAASLGQYEKSTAALADYYRTVELGLHACLRAQAHTPLIAEAKKQKGPAEIGAIVFGSDQGLVGQFNDLIADYAIATLNALQARAAVWTVGERVQGRLAEAGWQPSGLFAVPNSAPAIVQLVGKIIIETEARQSHGEISELYLFYNRPVSGAAYTPVSKRLLPLDEEWRRQLTNTTWPTARLPEVMGKGAHTLRALIREYLFVSLFRASAESLASENASRLAAMQRADKNIDDLLNALNGKFYRLRQSAIDEELFDVISGFEALSTVNGDCAKTNQSCSAEVS
jgi:F-type H+-transporting ATPase subunit gamma